MTLIEGQNGADHWSPVQLPSDPVDHRGPWQWATWTIASCALALLLVNAHSMQSWFNGLPPNPLTEPLRAPIVQWTDDTMRSGFDAPRANLRALWIQLQAARFGHEQPGDPGAGDAGA